MANFTEEDIRPLAPFKYKGAFWTIMDVRPDGKIVGRQDFPRPKRARTHQFLPDEYVAFQHPTTQDYSQIQKATRR